MSDKMIAERLQPSLLDRLTDEASDELVERRDDRVIDLRQLRDIIQRDLAALLNTANNANIIDPEVYPYVAESVLNYGITEVAGDYSTAERAERIRRSIINAVETFEPRISQGSLYVEVRKDKDDRDTLVNFDIRADMWAQPMPLELYLRSSVDVTTGELSLERVP